MFMSRRSCDVLPWKGISDLVLTDGSQRKIGISI